MDLPVNISLDQFIEAFREHTEASVEENGFSVDELAEVFSRSPEWVRRKLRVLNQRGLLRTSFKYSTSIDGRRIRVPIYFLNKGVLDDTVND